MRAISVCSQDLCPNPATGRGMCDDCRRAQDKTRGTSQERGYGADHRNLRAQLAPRVEAGKVVCWRCLRPIRPGQPWNLGHDDNDRSVYRGPEHRACNLAVKAHMKVEDASAGS